MRGFGSQPLKGRGFPPVLCFGRKLMVFEKVVSNACLGFFSPEDSEDLGRRRFRVGLFQGEGN